MKKLFLGMAVAASSLAFAQSFGVKGGMNVSSLSNDAGLEDAKSKIGFNAGVFMNAPLSSEFSIQPEILYNNLGSKVTQTYNLLDNTYKVESALHLDYISVPIMFQYNATPAFYLEAGPEFGFLIDARSKVKSSTNGDVNNSEVTKLDTDDFNTFNFGVGIGAGYWITQKLGINARYVAGFTDVAKDRPSGSDAVKNNNFQVGLAYKFN